MATIAERVYGQLTGEEGMPTYAPKEIPQVARSADPGHQSDPEGDLLGFASAFGLAWGIAKLDNPLASQDDVGKAALGAACMAWRWYTTVGGREGAEGGRG